LSKRLKILISAYACEPNRGSEPGVGWNWVKYVANKAEVCVVTRANDQRQLFLPSATIKVSGQV